MKNIKKTIYQSIKKDILKGFKRIYWFSYTRFKYIILTSNSFVKKKN